MCHTSQGLEGGWQLENSRIYNVPMHITLLREPGILYLAFFYLRMWKNCSSSSRRGRVSVWCVFCNRAVPSTKWLPVSMWHIMAGVTASQLDLAQRRLKGVGGTLEWFRQHGWELGDGWRKSLSLSQAHKEGPLPALEGIKASEKCAVPIFLGSYRLFHMGPLLFLPMFWSKVFLEIT